MARTARARGLSYSYDDGAGACQPSSAGASDLTVTRASPLPAPPARVDITMTSSSAGTAASRAPHLHISTTTTTTSPSSNQSLSPSTARSPSPRGGGTSGGGASGGSTTNQACAACKYQRRKCNPDCPLAPYFPADQQRRFLHAHRLFGVSNILKTLRRLRPELCADAMSTLIFQAEMRAQDPVGGCYRLVLGLERQLEAERAELAAVLHHLALCRQQAAAADLDVTSSNQPPPPPPPPPPVLLDADQEVVDALYASHEPDAATILHPHDDPRSPQQHHGEQQQLFDYFYYDTGDDASSKPVTLDINVDATLQQFDYDVDGGDQKVVAFAPAVHEELQQQQLDINCHIDHKEEDYDMKAALLVDVFDMRQAVDVNADDDIDVKAVDVNADVNINAVDVNAHMDLNEGLQEQDTKNNIAIGEAAQMGVESSSQCSLGLGFSAL